MAMNLIELQVRALEIAVGEVGTRETSANRGPRIAQYQKAAGISPGQPWCMAFIVFCFDEAARLLGGTFPLPRTGKVARFWRRSKDLWKTGSPTVGAIYCHLVDPKDPESPGHCGIVVRLIQGGIVGVEGNSNDSGAREGDRVLMKTRGFGYINLGFVDVAREGPDDVPRVA